MPAMNNKSFSLPVCPKRKLLRLFPNAFLVAIMASCFVAAISEGRAQTVQSWRGENTQGNLLNSTAWWQGFENTMVFGQQEFDNNTQTTMTNNNGGNVFDTYRWLFRSGASAPRTITGDGLQFNDFSGNDGGIYNESGATHVFNVAIEGDGAGDPFQIHLNSTGGLTFGNTVNNQGTVIDILGTAAGAKTVTFSGIVSGTAGMFVNNANATVLFDAANTQSGQLTINAGTVRLGSTDDTFGASTQAIRIGTGASLDLNNFSTIVGSVGEEGTGDGGTISLGSATLTVGGSATTFQNSISGTGGITHTGSGTLNLYGSQGYTGTTSVSDGTIATSVAMSSATYSITGTGIFSTSAADLISDTASMTLGGGTLSIGGAETFGNNGVTLSTSTSSTISVGSELTASVSGTVTGSGNVSKTGTGQLNLSGNNDYTGTVAVDAGVLNLNSGTGGAAASAASVSVASTARLLISQSEQVNNNAAVSLSGGTIKLEGTASETFGDLTVSSDSILDFGNLTGVNMSFGTYTPTQKITVNNFIGLSTLVFKSDMTSSINDPSKFSFANGFNSAVWNSGTSTFTITAIPEPSTYVAAAGLLAMFLWPVRRRMIKDLKSILSLRPTGRA